MKDKIPLISFVVGIIAIAVLSVLLAMSKASRSQTESDNAVLRSDNALQAQVISTLAFNFNRANQVAAETGRMNSLIGAESEETVIKYRDIIRNEKTCDLPVPDDIARGLLDYTARLRAGAMHAAAGTADGASDDALPTSTLTYCQAVLWINPLLSAIDEANNQLAGIRQIEQARADNSTKPQ